MRSRLSAQNHPPRSFRGLLTAIATTGAAVALCCATLPASAQAPPTHGSRSKHSLIIPSSSQSVSGDAGVRMHTNVRFLSGFTPEELPPYSGYGYETPASLACIYGLAPRIKGCNPNVTTQNATGGSQSIAIVDAYDDPNATADLAAFSQQFGLPFDSSKFQVVYAGGAEPPADPTGGWEFEESLDIEYAHAMAPNATIYLVEANSNYGADLYPAIRVATNLVSCGQTTTCPQGSKGRGEVSLSWGGAEFPQEVQLDSFFTAPGVVYFAAAGDAPGVIYPCASPNVVCVGGTANSRSLSTGDLIAQIAWPDTGGGLSFYEPIPGYQTARPFIAHQLQGARGLPDVSAIAQGVWVWDTFPYGSQAETGWFVADGTSIATPTFAGIVNSTGDFAISSVAEHEKLYGEGIFGENGFNDITYGACNYYYSSFADEGWDQCTGLGTPRRLK